ncbi:MAG: hypothetical protein ACYDEV_03930 [Acidiferrobacter sp.]
MVDLVRHHRVFIAGPRSQEASWTRYGAFHVIAGNGQDVVVENNRDLSRKTRTLRLR